MICFGYKQISLRPIPERVELGLLVQLHGNHHTVGQTFGAHVVVLDIRDERERAVGIAAGIVINRFIRQVAVK